MARVRVSWVCYISYGLGLGLELVLSIVKNTMI